MNEQIAVNCPYCNKQLSIRSDLAGTIATCGICYRQFQVPYPIAQTVTPQEQPIHINRAQHYIKRDKKTNSATTIVLVAVVLVLIVVGTIAAINAKVNNQRKFDESDYGVLYNLGKGLGQAAARGHHGYDGEGDWASMTVRFRESPAAFKRAKQANDNLHMMESRKAFLDGYLDGYRDGVR